MLKSRTVCSIAFYVCVAIATAQGTTAITTTVKTVAPTAGAGAIFTTTATSKGGNATVTTRAVTTSTTIGANKTTTIASTATKPSAATTDAMYLRFLEFKATYEKRYDTAAEEAKRYELFSRNFRWLTAYKVNVSRPYTLGVNNLMDLSDDEYAQLCGYRPEFQEKHDATLILSQIGPRRRKRMDLNQAKPGLYEVLSLPLIFGQMPAGPLPAAYDWREKGVVPPVQDQVPL